METVSKALDVGKRMIWGDTSPPAGPNEDKSTSDEPVSGVTGAGTSADPYDAGNRDGMPISPSH